MHTLLVIDHSPNDYRTLLSNVANEDTLGDMTIHYCDNIDDAKPLMQHVTIILGPPALITPLLPYATSLKWVQSSFAGVEPFMHQPITRPFILTGVKNVFGPMMSEYVFGYLFAIERQFFKAKEHQNAHAWQPLPYRSLKDLRLGICGLGSIGSHLASTAKHFGMHVSGLNSTGKPCENVDDIYATKQLSSFVKNQNYIVNVLPNTSQTSQLFNQAIFAEMDSDCVFINIGRGATVNTDDLIDALEQNMIRMAVLDVFEKEPLDKDSPLWSMDNVIITPHNSAVSFAHDVVDIFVENFHLFSQNKPLNYEVDFARGY